MLMKLSSISLPVSVFLSGLYGGIGFFTIMGGNPSLKGLSSAGFAEYWQHIDSYMGARMPLFGPVLLLSVLFSVIALMPDWRSLSFWLVLLAFLFLVADLVFTFSINHPLNKLIQDWDLQNLPANVQEVKARVINAFWYRSFFMISSFTCITIAAFVRNF
jgi:MFS superfamily sulfate permease-like transporter